MPISHAARHAAAAALTLGLATSAGGAAAQTDELRTTHGDWQIRCAPGTEDCVMAQVGKGPQGNDLLEMRIRKLDGVTGQNGEQVPAAIQILTPLGVALKAGVRVQIDASEVRGAAFEVCAQAGCVVREPMGTKFVDEMKGGNTATVTLAALPGEGPVQELTSSISLRGFTAAFNDLQP
ncbi:MAG: invasion associated locus B family protein [Pseudomonadota bacterium]